MNTTLRDEVHTHPHYSVLNKLDIERAENVSSPMRKVVCEHEDVTIVRNEALQRDRVSGQ